MLRQLRRAIIERTSVRFAYHTRYTKSGRSEHSTREADPYALVHFVNAWHLVAYCHMRQGIRNFRLERMDALELLSETFKRPVDFTLEKLRQDEPGKMVVHAVFDKEVARWVCESPPYYTVGQEETDEGLLVTLRVRQESEILQWLLSWGRSVRVLEPESLRKRLAEEAEAVLRNYRPGTY
jgi:predicted DNA-binding transcriptional regulator YafY